MKKYLIVFVLVLMAALLVQITANAMPLDGDTISVTAPAPTVTLHFPVVATPMFVVIPGAPAHGSHPGWFPR
jgi:hypothetical protein